MNCQLLDVAWLGKSHSVTGASTLTTAVLDLVDNDHFYKAYSVLKLLDLAVGSDKNRSTKPKVGYDCPFSIKIYLHKYWTDLE